MKIVYIAHPIGGDVEGNLKKILAIVRQINLTEPDVVPFVPYFVDCHALNDGVPEERDRGIKNDREFFIRRVFDELRLYGDRISPGMSAEIDLAKEFGIAVVPMTEEIADKYYGPRVTRKR